MTHNVYKISFEMYSINSFFLFQIFNIIIIRGCNGIEQKYSELLEECYRLQIRIWNEPSRADLQLFEYYIRNFPPVFTVAGFFQLNQKLCSSFCIEIVTYLIVVIQFSTVNPGTNSFLQNMDSASINISETET